VSSVSFASSRAGDQARVIATIVSAFIEDPVACWACPPERLRPGVLRRFHGARLRHIRWAAIALIFQEPMSSFSPVHTIGDQISEAIVLHHVEFVRQRIDSGEAALRFDHETLDIDGPLDEHPEFFRFLSTALRAQGHTVLVLT